MAYEIFHPILSGRPLSVTIASKGRIILNAGTTSLFRNECIKHVLLLWDAQGPTVGIQPTEHEPRSFKVSYATSNATIYAPAFIEYVHAERGGYFATWNGLLEFNLECEIVRVGTGEKAAETQKRKNL